MIQFSKNSSSQVIYFNLAGRNRVGIIKFAKSKSVPKKVMNKDSLVEQKLDKIPLQKKLKANFLKYKINNIKARENNAISDNLFIRDKSQITIGMDQLQNKIKLENYHDKKKLAASVFEDFEKQTSWQSYTTLLITDIMGDKQAKLGETFKQKV